METLLQPLIYGLQMGLVYILMALGLTLIFSIMNIMNLAHGEMYMLGAFSVFFVCHLMHINFAIALLIGMVMVGLIGLILERLVFRPVRGDEIRTVIIAMALMLVLQTSAQLGFGREPKGMGEVFLGTVSFLNVNISQSRVVAALISVALLAGVHLFVYRTKHGRAMQAIAQDREAAALQGIDINRVGALGFGLGCALAAAAGGIMAPIFFIEANMGMSVLITSLCIIILGGLGSIPGAAIGGLILGLAESYGYTFLGYPAVILPFFIMILILVFKPTGLMGRESVIG